VAFRHNSLTTRYNITIYQTACTKSVVDDVRPNEFTPDILVTDDDRSAVSAISSSGSKLGVDHELQAVERTASVPVR